MGRVGVGARLAHPVASALDRRTRSQAEAPAGLRPPARHGHALHARDPIEGDGQPGRTDAARGRLAVRELEVLPAGALGRVGAAEGDGAARHEHAVVQRVQLAWLGVEVG